MITHYDLFAGIGGFSLALEEVFKGETVRHIFCEWEAFPTAVLKQHWPGGVFYGDIADLVAHTKHKGSIRRTSQGSSSVERLDSREQKGSQTRSTDARCNTFTVVTGGFPCQPFSHAGKRLGTADDRYQWPNMFEIIRSVSPEWVIAENVRGLLTWNKGMAFEQVCTDLESEGYEVQPFIIPAAGIGAPHRRDRIWVIAHSERSTDGGAPGKDGSAETQERLQERDEIREPGKSGKVWSDWNRDWREVALATCNDTVDDGIPRRMDGSTISSAQWRNESLKAYGNAIVPQVAMEIFKAIKETL